MGTTLRRRLGSERRFPLGQEAALALVLAAGDLGSVFESIFRRNGLTHTRYNVLRILRGGGDAGLPHAAIGERLLVPSPDVTRLIDRLVEAGWVERVRGSDDRRVVLHRLTDEGRALLETLDAPLAAVHESIVEVLGEPRALRLVALCESLITAVEDGSIGGGGDMGEPGQDRRRRHG